MKKLIKIGIYFLLPFFVESQVQWPTPTPNQQSRIAGTIGEYRYTTSTGTHRFHKGIDISNDNSIYDVHAINSGGLYYRYTGNAWTSYLRIETTLYYHVRIDNPTISNTEIYVGDVDVGDYIGNMFYDGGCPYHVHLEDPNNNYLNQQLFPFQDNTNPSFCDDFLSDGMAFYRNGILKTTDNYQNLELSDYITINDIEYLLLYNKIDIAAHVKDTKLGSDGNEHPNGPGQTAPYMINFKLENQENEEVHNEEITFTNTPNNSNALYCFHPASNHPGSPSIHILTSNPYAINNNDRYWNTKLKKGLNETWPGDNSLDAILNDDLNANYSSQFEDGIYTISFNAYDVDYNSNPNNYAQNSIENNVLIDNHKPYIKKVTISSGGVTYEGGWAWYENHGVNGQLEYYYNGVSISTVFNSIEINVNTSEPMQSLSLAIESLGGFSPTSYSNDKKNWTFSIPSNIIQDAFNGGSYGEQQCLFSGFDLANNHILGFSTTDPIPRADIPYRQADGTWSDTNKKNTKWNTEDQIHSFFIGTGTNGNDLQANFNYSQNSEPPNAEVSFSDASTGDIINWNWSFQGGTPNSSNNTNPVISFPTAGNYNITLNIEDDEGYQSQQTKTIYITQEINNNITIDYSTWAVDDYSYDFTVDVYNTDPLNTVEIIAYFDDGVSADLTNFIPYNHTYSEPSSVSVMNPYAEIIVKDHLENIIKQETIFFGNITLSPSFYDIDISTDINNLTHPNNENAYPIQPGEEVEFEANASNAYGNITWYWFINKNSNDFTPCYCNSANCECETAITSNLQTATANTYTFDDPGQYYIYVNAVDEGCHQGYQDFILDVQYAEDECIDANVYFDYCASNYYVPSTVNEMMIEYVALPDNFLNSCWDNNSNQWIYDDIYRITYYINDNQVDENIYEESGIFPGYDYYCFDYLTETGLYTLRMDFQAGYYTTQNHSNGSYNIEPADGVESIQFDFEMVNCLKNINITSQAQLDDLG